MHKLNLFTPINSLGYGIVGVNLFKVLSQHIDVALFSIGNIHLETDELAPTVQEAVNKGRIFNGFNEAPCLKIWHEHDLSTHIGNGQQYAFPFFEINKLDQTRINHLSSMDTIIVASQWAKDVIINNGQISTPVKVVPLGVDPEIFTYKSQPVNDVCVFLNCGKWEKRKGHDILLEMFKKAFPNENNVALWMMPSNPFLSNKNRYEWERYYNSDSRVKIIEHLPTHKEVANVMSLSYCGIFPSRAEGWNLELLEMMAMGKYVITTNYSAHTQFCDSNNSKLITINNLEKAEDAVFFTNSIGEWASLDGQPFDQGVEYLRYYYEQWKSDPTIKNEEGIKTAQQLSWTNTAQQLEGVIYGNQSTKIEQALQTA